MPEHTVLEFTYVELRGDWTFNPYWMNVGAYTADADSEVIAVARDATGAAATYSYKLPQGTNVMISYSENLVYIPTRCAARAEGDQIRCEGG